ncbi:general stress protein 16O [Clostridium acetireducens DSM 10703]|jgi:YteA family regulatory protein|uniref:General stress protein 16O n=1 Tax=Clostridium acetireducens DSM 10703 TaxID=1121290 RepID=A0A1E8F2G0_9CLOT|nr:TraR/DksA C4-type zinc finger protein [Clostridium acetireducens]OFI07564.1 general stress protein 16O [Clostridium acetireducens DSM 10703]
MDENKLDYFRKKLNLEKENVYSLLKHMEENETINSNSSMSMELSVYDNHPSDVASELYEKEKGLALKSKQVDLIKKIDSALNRIDQGEYGKCKICGKDILQERLEFIPYAEYCVQCQNNISGRENVPNLNKTPGESLLNRNFGYGFNDYDVNESVGFDAEDSYQSVERFNRLENIYEYYDDDDKYVDLVDRISNEQYKNQLPD